MYITFYMDKINVEGSGNLIWRKDNNKMEDKLKNMEDSTESGQ